MAKKVGRPLGRQELVRFKGENKQDFRLSNLVLFSKQASAKELYLANGMSLGYSHCLCGCGQTLNIEIQKDSPHVYAPDHKPKKESLRNLKQARKPKDKVIVENLARVGQPLLVIPKEQSVPETSLKDFRGLFERMICDLPWNDFEKLLKLLLDVSKKGK